MRKLLLIALLIVGCATKTITLNTDEIKTNCKIECKTFIIASKGFSVLYLFLLADLLCCAFVFTVFYSFYNKQLNERTAYTAIIIGLIGGFFLFPTPDFSKSLLVGVILNVEFFPTFVSQSLLFLSFLVATAGPAIVIMSHDSFKGR